VPALLAARDDLRLTVFAGAEAYPSLLAEAWAGDVTIVRIPVRARSRARRVLAEQTVLAPAARRARIDVLHNTLNTAPLLAGVPQVTTIHDVIYKRFPETAGRLNAGVALLVPLAARRSQLVLTDSEASRNDIVELLGVDSRRVAVAPLGPGLPEPDEPLEDIAVRDTFGLGEKPIVLTVAAKRPHKNLARLLEAFERLETDASLLIPGFETQFEVGLKQQAGKRVRFLGWVDDSALDGLYRAAACFVLPSLAEGFGLPVLESMTRGTPVACSNIAPLREVAAEAALYFDPHDSASIARSIESLLAEAELRAQLSAAGLERGRLFTWSRTAELTLSCYERTLG
jgi:glycosyltransferase involved in cell wall biosynthesis